MAALIQRFNDWLAVVLSNAFSAMGCFYALCALALAPVLWPRTIPYLQFISSGVLRLVALPLLAVATRVIQRKQAEHPARIDALIATKIVLIPDRFNRKVSGTSLGPSSGYTIVAEKPGEEAGLLVRRAARL